MRRINRLALHLVVVSLVALAMSGCATTTDPNTVTYPDGSYKMYGDGTTVPYYWVWVPNGVTQPNPPAPPALPPNQPAVVVQSGTALPPNQPAVVVQSGTPGVAPTVVAPPPTTVAASNGRYQLYGNGTTQPYYWVWVPTGATVPAPPPLPRRIN
jgi:hypothetical protein